MTGTARLMIQEEVINLHSLEDPRDQTQQALSKGLH